MMIGSRAFPHGGIYILRHKDLYMVVDCGSNGLDDWGGHAHNDTLSFELCVGNTTFITDPGTFAYTGSDKWHRTFRSTALHNTIMVDGKELNRFKPHDFWGLQYDAVPTINLWKTELDFDFLDVQHDGYLRLTNPVVHRRQIFFHKGSPPFWIIKDILLGQGQHTFASFLHIGEATPQLHSPSIVNLQSNKAPDEQLIVIPMEEIKGALSIRDSWRAPSYGHKKQSKIVCYEKETSGSTIFVTLLYPSLTGEPLPQDLEKICLIAQQEWAKRLGDFRDG